MKGGHGTMSRDVNFTRDYGQLPCAGAVCLRLMRGRSRTR